MVFSQGSLIERVFSKNFLGFCKYDENQNGKIYETSRACMRLWSFWMKSFNIRISMFTNFIDAPIY